MMMPQHPRASASLNASSRSANARVLTPRSSTPSALKRGARWSDPFSVSTKATGAPAWYLRDRPNMIWTAVEIMLGLSRKYHAGAPVAFVDTEKGSDHLAPRFKALGVELLGVKTRAFADLLDAFKDAEARGCCGIIIDSATHFWDELRKSYAAKLNRAYGLKISDWG